MNNRIGPVDMFYLKSGSKIQMKDGRIIELTSGYNIETLSYDYVENGQSGTIKCLSLSGGMIIE